MYIVYETTCLINGKKYLGVHNREDDGYLGSGNLIKKAIKRYGKKSFVRKTLHKFATGEEAYAKERELITEAVVNSPDYYNLVVGGMGSSTTGLKNTKDYSNYSKASKKRWADADYKEAACESMRRNWKRTPERIHRLQTQNIGRKLSTKHKDALHQGRANTAQRYNIEGDKICYIGLTLSEFCATLKLNVSSCRQCVWKRGTYKGYKFISTQGWWV
jgi:hypothetical protein